MFRQKVSNNYILNQYNLHNEKQHESNESTNWFSWKSLIVYNEKNQRNTSTRNGISSSFLFTTRINILNQYNLHHILIDINNSMKVISSQIILMGVLNRL